MRRVMLTNSFPGLCAVNVSALLKAIDAPRRVEIAESLAAQPSNVRVTSSQDIGTAGVWVPLHIGREVARSCSAPKPLLDIFLHDNLPDYVSFFFGMVWVLEMDCYECSCDRYLSTVPVTASER
jgi:hypothetical protein